MLQMVLKSMTEIKHFTGINRFRTIEILKVRTESSESQTRIKVDFFSFYRLTIGNSPIGESYSHSERSYRHWNRIPSSWENISATKSQTWNFRKVSPMPLTLLIWAAQLSSELILLVKFLVYDFVVALGEKYQRELVNAVGTEWPQQVVNATRGVIKSDIFEGG